MNRHESQNVRAQVVSADSAEVGRRRFLKIATATGIALPFGVSMMPVKRFSAYAQERPSPRSWEIEAVRVEQTFSDGSIVPFYRYHALGSTPVAGGVPVLTGWPGERARLSVRNSLPLKIRPLIVGGKAGPIIEPGTESTLDFVMPPEGTWLLTDDVLGDAAGPMGLGAVIVSRTLQASALDSVGQPHGYDREYVLLYVDSDDRWNNEIANGRVPNLELYEPNYHTVNSLTFPDTTTDPGTAITCQVGERVLLRMCNLGWVRQSIHFHGYHVDIERINNQRQLIYGPKDTIPLPGHTTMEVLLTVNQPGIFPVHPHSLTTTTDNGLYIGGQITLITAT